MPKTPEDNASTELSRRIDALIAIMLNPLRIQEANMRDKIALLDSFGFANQDIAKILRTTPKFVSKEKSLLKKGSETQ